MCNLVLILQVSERWCDCIYLQEYIAVINPFDQLRPTWLFNFDITEASQWKRLVLEQLPPCCLPQELHALGMAYRIVSRDWVLRASLRSGLWMTLAQIQQTCRVLQLPKPTRGSGKNGNIIKHDWCSLLVESVCPGDSVKDKEYMVEFLRGGAKPPVDPDALGLLSTLDAENADAYKEVKKQAFKQFESTIKINAKTESKEEARKEFAKEMEKATAQKEAAKKEDTKRMWDLTPTDLKSLCPGNGKISGVFYIRHHPFESWFRSTYPVSNLG